MEKYTRFFEATASSFILESLYTYSYSDLKCYSIKRGKSTLILFENLEKEKCEQSGLELISNEETFNKYYQDFNEFLNKADELIEKNIKGNNLYDSIDIFIQFLAYYRWTESFYTDYAYKILKNNDNLKKLEKIKTEARIFLNRFFNGESSYLNRIANKSYDKEKFLNSSIAEIKDSIQISNEELKKRQDYHVFSYEQKIYDRNTDIFKNIEESLSFSEKNKIIKGIGASKGKVKGKAYVLSANFENFDLLDEIIENMPDKVILISETTAPDIIKACHKSIGIVTNQGGLGSHAAIISRELKIPCVVGTKNATNILKTGDIIIVDGYKGEVILDEK